MRNNVFSLAGGEDVAIDVKTMRNKEFSLKNTERMVRIKVT